MAAYFIAPLTEEEARQILTWRYPPPFDYYDPPDYERPGPIIAEFLDPANGFHGVRDDHGAFVGFCSFGRDGQVPGGQYDSSALDLGLGMKPAYTGLGQGGRFFSAIIHHAHAEFDVDRLRLTVADFNHRAIRVYRRSGFNPVAQFRDQLNAEPHTIMERLASKT